jgi:hypothetical protein
MEGTSQRGRATDIRSLPSVIIDKSRLHSFTPVGPFSMSVNAR